VLDKLFNEAFEIGVRPPAKAWIILFKVFLPLLPIFTFRGLAQFAEFVRFQHPIPAIVIQVPRHVPIGFRHYGPDHIYCLYLSHLVGGVIGKAPDQDG
jgi:hypothetical protein